MICAGGHVSVFSVDGKLLGVSERKIFLNKIGERETVNENTEKERERVKKKEELKKKKKFKGRLGIFLVYNFHRMVEIDGNKAK